MVEAISIKVLESLLRGYLSVGWASDSLKWIFRYSETDL